MKIRFLTLAQIEVDEAVAWYDQRSTKLGQDFLIELDLAVRRIISFPFSCPEIEPGLRRCLIAYFPYGIIYNIDEDTIVVLAVANLHREPRYWIGRAS